MNSLCKTFLAALILLFVSCTETVEPLFEDIYVYKNTLPNNVSIECYRRNSVIVSAEINDSLSISSSNNRFNYNFSPSLFDSIIFKFYDGKKIVFKYEPTSSNWNVNAVNHNVYKTTYEIERNLTTQFYTYTIDKKIYELAN
jgi:hypothetical protein